MMKKLLALLCVVLVAVVSVVGTLAYLTDRESVANTFTVGNVDIKLDEAETNEKGEVQKDNEGNEIRTEEGNEYHLIPGETYTKDPTVTVLKGSEESYVRMIVTITHASQLEAIFNSDAGKTAYPGGFLPQDHVTGWDKETWVPVSMEKDDENNFVLEFRYKETVSTMEPKEDKVLPALFEEFTLPGFITGDQLKTIADLEIHVEGHAIQAATFESADEAWTAFEAQYTSNP